MFITAIILGLTLAAFAYFWNYIREVLNGPVQDMLRKHYGVKTEQWFTKFLKCLDEVMVDLRKGIKWTKEQLRGAWLWFGETFLNIDTTYLQIDGTHLSSKTKSIMRLNETEAVVRTEETILRYDELPEPVRQEMDKQKANEYKVNEKEVVERQYKERLALYN
ncbi:MAG: hypothetical protein LBJ67_06710 [Planctomycetaceae bacterium]|jgi:hypothetical protein|nr:hypothetical protein [Planctomycetaceae bacterium]